MEKIIVQDADRDVLEVLETALLLEGFIVYAMPEFEENFLEFIDKARPHVVMLDYRVDGKECIRICKEIKSKYPHLPVVALSCNSNIHEVYSRYGFDDYIRKPFDLDLLYRVLRTHLKKEDL
jgi:DNA-binding response OmpR family regulator